MRQFLVKKITEALITLFLVATLIFALMHLAPGNPFIDEHVMSHEAISTLKAHYGLDNSLPHQYIRFLKGIVIGDFGPSLSIEGVRVSMLISQGFPLSLKLGSLAFFFSLIFGFFLSLSLVFSTSPVSRKITRVLNTSCLAMPSFIAAVLLQYVLAIKLDLFPASGSYSMRHLILPALSLSLIPAGIIARLLKTKLEEVLELPYTLSAKSKGLGPIRLFFFHLLPGALLPTLSYLGPLAATLVTGSFAAEKVFALPGLGSWFVMSLSARDYPLIAGLTLFYTLFVVGFSFLVDMLYALFDPKLKGEFYETI
jgi:oligopeptide transport system permease protein